MASSHFPQNRGTRYSNTLCQFYNKAHPSTIPRIKKLKSSGHSLGVFVFCPKGITKLPACQMQYAKQARFIVAEIAPPGTQTILSVNLRDLSPIRLSRVKNYAERQLWYEYMD